MSILDDLKAKANALRESQGPKVTEGIDKVRGFADDKTDGKFSEQVQNGIQKAKDVLDSKGRKS